jgi:light-regulated signal transduction histidine kinase (bacteriophytochrome)
VRTDTIDITGCDREPIHTPGAIQPHGLLLVVDSAMTVTNGAGDFAGRLGLEPGKERALAHVVGDTLAAFIAESSSTFGFAGQMTAADGETLDVSFYRTEGGPLLVEMEPALGHYFSPSAVLGDLESAANTFERAVTLDELCNVAAAEFRRMTGYDRVLVYRFLEGGAGVVLAEARDPAMDSFMNHHFPASDIPAQARALYVRNLVRVIPDIHYSPEPLNPAWGGDEPLDMSDSTLRSVSPVHLRYLANMGVAASASVSIVKDGALWGLIACHNATPLGIGYDVRAACRVLASGLARQIKAREEIDIYRERIRLRSFEDDIVGLLTREGGLDQALSNHVEEVRRMLAADGVAVLRGRDIMMSGTCPDEPQVRALADTIMRNNGEMVFATHQLSTMRPEAEPYRKQASGVLAITLSVEEYWTVLWFRAEHLETVNWAGNPHKEAELGPGETLSPRASFAAWSETVRGRSRPWTLAEVEAGGRLRDAVLAVWHNRRLRELNSKLMATIGEKDLLLQQKQFLIGEVNHRVQNSLQLVSSFLSLQARQSEDKDLQSAIEEARRRIGAVSLVHRRLYRADQFETVDVARYIEELLGEQFDSMGPEWARHITRDLAPVIVSPDRAVSIGLIVAELVTNANKYAYDGGAGPLHISLSEDAIAFRLSVADRGKGRASTRRGFGTRMMEALVGQLNGTLVYRDNDPGLEAVLTAPSNVARVAAVH